MKINKHSRGGFYTTLTINGKKNFIYGATEEAVDAGHRAFPIIYTILYTGMRMGEALGLLWKDIDFDAGIIKVTKATEYDHSKPKTKDPKTEKGIRNIPMPSELQNYMKQYQKSVKKSLYVFPGHVGGPMGLIEMNRIWKSAQKRIANWFKSNEEKIRKEERAKGKNWTDEAKANWEKRLADAQAFMKEHNFDLTFRLLRHTYYTGLYDTGIDEVSAAELMGHDVMIMREVYTHIQESRKQKTVVKLDSLYKENIVIEIMRS